MDATPYLFTLTATSPNGWTVAIDATRLYGYFDCPDGSEGGGLWFERIGSRLRLVDQDGTMCCPRGVILALRSLRVIVPRSFE